MYCVLQTAYCKLVSQLLEFPLISSLRQTRTADLYIISVAL